MPQFLWLAENTFLVRGSPAALTYMEGGTLYVIDPGHGGGRVKSLGKLIRDLKPAETIAVITHYHSDHLEVVSRRRQWFDEVLAPRPDAPGVESGVYRLAMTFGYPLDPSDPYLVFPAPDVEGVEVFEPGERIGPLETVHLPGHTPGQVGVVTPSSILYGADAVFGTGVLGRYSLPYHRDPCIALHSLDRISETGVDTLVPGHGPVTEASGIPALVEANKSKIRESLSRIQALLSEGAYSIDELLPRVVDKPADTPGLHMLLEQVLRGALLCLSRQGLAEPLLEEGRLKWRAR